VSIARRCSVSAQFDYEWRIRHDISKIAAVDALDDILGSQPRSFRQWVADHATDFTEGPLSDEA
jgi:hypothetical protein